jgi:predicted alpha/beta-hydrolase family hydrolase
MILTRPQFKFDGPGDASLTLVLAHGAGAPMDTPFMSAFAEGLGDRGWRVARFEFAYMAARRADGRKRPPPRQDDLMREWRDSLRALGPGPRVIGGKSLGGRMASLVADEVGVRGLVCLGYPFHPPGNPEKLRTAHLQGLNTPTLILQGSRDPFGSREDVAGYALSPAIRVHWAEDGDHGLKPRKASGRSESENWREAIDAIDKFLHQLRD